MSAKDKKLIKNTKTHHPKIDLCMVSSVPTSGCPYQNDDKVVCFNHRVELKDDKNIQYICMCNDNHPASKPHVDSNGHSYGFESIGDDLEAFVIRDKNGKPLNY